MSPCCAHRRVRNENNGQFGTVTAEWWECEDCKTRFVPEREVRELRAEERVRNENYALRAQRDKLAEVLKRLLGALDGIDHIKYPYGAQCRDEALAALANLAQEPKP